MSLRSGWKFRYSCSQVAKAARDKAAYHNERIKFWQREESVTREDLKQKGVELRDYAVTGGVDTQVVVDPEIKRRLDECRTKIRGHQSLKEEYEMYARACEISKEMGIELDAQDVLFFGL